MGNVICGGRRHQDPSAIPLTLSTVIKTPRMLPMAIANAYSRTWVPHKEAPVSEAANESWTGLQGKASRTHLRMRAMVSFLSLPWNGSDPVSISNCRATQNGESEGPDCPGGQQRAGMAKRNRSSFIPIPTR